jgi:O-methyltransferase involved in polyketide biosynthesis
VVQQFIIRHPDAVALDLGVGLDTRVFRIAPPPTVDWYDIDFPEVITARHQLLPDGATAHGIGTDLTDPRWLDAVPSDRPAVIVADGLMAFLTQDDMIALLNRLISHFPGGEVAFNGYGRFAIWAAKHYPRHAIGRGSHQVSWLRRPPRTRTLESQAAAGQGDPAYARARWTRWPSART